MVELRRLLIVLLVGGAALSSPLPRTFAQETPIPPLDPAAKKAAGQFLKRLFGALPGQKERQPTEAENAAEENESGSAGEAALDPVDERAVVNREQRTQLLRAQKMLASGQQDPGLRLLQHLLNAEEDSVVLTSDGRWRSLHAVAEEAILRGGPNVRNQYRKRYANVAQDRLKQARADGSLRALARVTRRYFATPAGEAAANEIGSLMADAGHAAEAAYWYQRLIDADARIARNPRWQRKAALVLRRAGRTEHGTTLETGDAAAPSKPSDTNSQESPSSPFTTTTAELSDWKQPFGGPTHTGRVAAGDPALIERWSQPITERPENVEQITQLVDDLQDNGRACIPAAVPLAVDGKILFRTLRGLSVVDAASGRLLWETPEAVSVERLLAGESVSRPATEAGLSRLRPMPRYEGNGADQHALTNLLFRDGVYGLVSSDGEQAFVLEDHATLSYRKPGYYRGQPRNDDPRGRDWESNRIAAYNLETGQRQWSVGGPEGGGPFAPKLAGTLFHGPPVVEGDELFVIGEHRGAEILFVLNRRTGRPLWSHMLSGVTSEIQYDLVRRWWPALPAVGKGVIICPTTVGWVVAIDRHEHRIRWAQRLTKRRREQRHSRQATVAMTSPLNSRWLPSAPVLAGDRVVITPSELPDSEYHTIPQVLCLDALTGESRWQQEKQTGLYLGGVIDGAVLLVGTDQIESRNLSDGRRRWRTPLPEATGPPSGRGVVTGTDYLLPLQSGELWRIHLADGSVAERSRALTEHQPLGNLLMSEKRLVSLSFLGASCFEDREAVASLLTKAGTEPLDIHDRLRAAELQVIDGNHESAAALLRGIGPAAIDEGAAKRVRKLRRTSLLAIIRQNPGSTREELSELETLAETDQHVLTVRRLQAEQHLANGRRLAAFGVYWPLAGSPKKMLVDEGDTSVRLDCWLAARLAEVWTAMDAAERADIDEQIETAVATLSASPPATLAWWAQVLAFHPAGRRLEQQLAERAREAGRIAESEIRWERLLNGKHPPETRANTLRKLIALLDSHSRSEDAAWYFGRSVGAIADADARIGDELRRWYGQRRTQETGAPLAAPRSDWASGTYSLTRTSAMTGRRTSLVSLAIDEGLPSMDGLRFRLRPGLQRLGIYARDGQQLWETPLRALHRSHYDQSLAVAFIGQLMLVVHQDILHAVSLPDRQLLWQRPIGLRAARVRHGHVSSARPPREMRKAVVLRQNGGLSRQQAGFGTLVAWTPEYLCYLGRNSITATDPLTGETLWVRQGIRANTVVAGNRRHLFILPPEPASPFAVRVADGTQVELPHLEPLLAAAIDVFDEGLVTLETGRTGDEASGDDANSLRLADPVTGASVWQATFPKKTFFARLEGATLLALQPDGTLRLIDWAARTDRLLGQLDPQDVPKIHGAHSIFAVADQQQVYLSLNDRPDRNYRSDIYYSQPVNGLLVAFDRQGSGLAWQQKAENEFLLLGPLQHLPVLVLHARHTAAADSNLRAQQIHFEMLDKWTGRRLLDETRYVSPGSFRSVEYDPAARIIDLKAYRERLRLQPAEIGPIPE